MDRGFFICLLLLCLFSGAKAQQTDDDTPPLPLYVKVSKDFYQGDSIPHITTPTLYKYPPIDTTDRRTRARYDRLVRNVKKVLPIAKLVRQTVIETTDYLETLPTEEAKKRHIEAVEKGIRKQYTPMMKKLTYSQGKLLIKLIDRECNQSSYEMVKAFMGPLKAGFYNAFATLFGASLKKGYDPDDDDRFTERVVRMVESGQL